MQDYANQIAQMFVGYQITLVDIPRLVMIGRGRIEVDLFSGVTTIDNETASPFSISEAVNSWYKDAVLRDVLDESFIRSVRIVCDFDTNESVIDTGSERKVTLKCKVTVEAENGISIGVSDKSERWRKSGEESFWQITDT
jgi:hypothetical protein